MNVVDQTGLTRFWGKVKTLVADCLPKTGGTVSGDFGALTIKRTANDYSAIRYLGSSGATLGYIGCNPSKQPLFTPDGTNLYTIYHSGNLTLSTLGAAASSHSHSNYADKTSTSASLTSLNTAVGNIGTQLASDEANISGLQADVSTLKGYFSGSSAKKASKLGTSTVGSANRPIYLSSGSPAAVSSVGEAFLSWGGQNFSGAYGPIDSAMVPDLSANRSAFIKPAGVTIEYSRNGGSTWTDYGASDSTKIGLFSNINSGILIGKADTTNKATESYKLRITISTSAAGIYTVLNKFVLYLSTNGSTGCTCTITARLQSNYESGTETWATFADKVALSGWSGYNVINISNLTTYGNTKTSQYGQVRFLFECTGGSTSYAGLTVYRILCFGGVGWTTPSTMASTGHIYSYDASKNVTFPATVTATFFSGYLTGTSSSAAKWATARTITIGSTGKSVDGSGNVSWTLAEIGAAASSHSHSNYADKTSTSSSLTSLNTAVGNIGTQLATDEANISGLQGDVYNLKSYFSSGVAKDASKLGGVAASSYLQKSGGTITNDINRNAGGSWISARDHVVVEQSKVTSSEGSSWNPVVGIKTAAGYWSIGTVGGESFCFSHDTDANYNSGNNTSTVIYIPLDSGTIALTKNIPSSLPASDVYSWAKASSKPSYTASEVGAAASSHSHSNYADKTSTSSSLTSLNTAVGNIGTQLASDEANISGLQGDVYNLKSYFSGGVANDASKLGGVAASSYFKTSGGNISGHIYLTGSNATSSTSNTSQIIFGTSSSQHVAISSNTAALVINASKSSTTNQVVLRASAAASTMYALTLTQNLTVGGNLTVTGSISAGGATFLTCKTATSPPASSVQGSPGSFIAVSSGSNYTLYVCLGQVYTNTWLWREVSLR